MLPAMSDGIVTIQPPRLGDSERLIAGRDAEWEKWLGPGNDDVRPIACILVAGEVVGWVDYDTERAWLEGGEVNIGYNVFAPHRRHGYASRAVELLVRYLDESTEFHTATLLIAPGNVASLALAARFGFIPNGDLDGNPYFKRPTHDAGPGQGSE